MKGERKKKKKKNSRSPVAFQTLRQNANQMINISWPSFPDGAHGNPKVYGHTLEAIYAGLVFT